MNKEFFDKHSKDLGCSDCSNLQYCIERENPSYISCAMTYYKEQVADLETKLAECEKDRLMWQEMYKRADKQNKNICETDIYPLQEENQQLKDKLEIKMEELHIAYCAIENVKTKNGNLKAEVKQLKQQLAEKNKEIEEVRSNHANLVADIAYKAVNVYTAESKETGVPTFYKIHYSQLLEIEDMDNLRNYAQDKILFAIEQLEKVKEFFLEEHRDEEMNTDYIITKGASQITDYLLDQIKQLKEKKSE